MACSIVTSAVQQLKTLSENEFRFLYDVKSKITSLEKELEYMREFLINAESLPHQDPQTRQRVRDVRDFAYEAEDIVEMYVHKVSHPREEGLSNTLKWLCHILVHICETTTLHNLGSDIDRLKKKISDRKGWVDEYKLQHPSNNNQLTENDEQPQTYSHTLEEEVVGFEEDVRQVVEKLVIDPKVSVVSISGTGGLGKTTLARKVFSHETIKQHFDDNDRVWVYVSRKVDKIRIFRDILFGLNKTEDSRKQIGKLRDAELPGAISDILKERKCLVILDNIWTVAAWNTLKTAFASLDGKTTNSESKILLTTRDQNLLQISDFCRYSHCLNPLSPEDSWNLFQLKAFPKEDASSSTDITMANANGEDKVPCDDPVKCEMEILGRKMLERLDGLPIAIVALGGILSTKKTLYEWQRVAKNTVSHLTGDTETEGSDNRILELLALSYCDLPFKLKPCFLHLGNFPEDHEISTQRLYHLWKAEGFLEGEEGTTYDIGESYLNGLVRRSMVQVGECWKSGMIKTCKIHDVMRDMCLKKAKDVNFSNKIECTRSDMESMVANCSGEEVRRCTIYGKDEVGEQTRRQHIEKTTCLRSLLVFLLAYYGNEEIPAHIVSPDLWKSFPLLRVLDLEGTRSICSIGGVEHLILLRYLSLRNTEVIKIPSSIYNLKYLETLDLRCNWQKMMLCNKFHEMERLRHLYLPADIGVEGDEKLTFRSQMETMKNFNPKKCETECLMKMTNIRVFSMKDYYWFKAKDVLEGVLKAPFMINPEQLIINSFRLKVRGDLLEKYPTILSSFITHPNLTKFSIAGPSMLLKSVDFGKDGWGNVFAKTLTWVQLWECDIGEGGLSALEELPCLKQLHIHGRVLVGRRIKFSALSFKQLNVLYLIGQREMEEWEIGEGALPNLQSLELVRCKRLNHLPNGFPNSIHIDCDPCIRGIERYNTCPHFKAQGEANFVDLSLKTDDDDDWYIN